MNPMIFEYSPKFQKETKEFILNVWKEFGFSYHQQWDFDLDDFYEFYIKNGGMFYILLLNEKIIGTMGIIKLENNIAELKRFYIDIKHRRKGFGSMLVTKALEFCREKKFSKIEFETNKKFVAAHALYLKRGFKIVREDYRSFYMEKVIE